MPLDGEELWGTEKDGSKSHEYCKYCYQDGAFTHPEMNVEEMAKHIASKMEKQEVPADIIDAAIGRLSRLKRWKSAVKA